MNRIIILIGAALIALGCNGAARQTTETNNAAGNSNGSSIVQVNGNQTVVSSHSGNAEKTVVPRNDAPSSGSPMARPIDVSAMTADIEKAEKEYKKNPKAKEDLARAYFVRATALTGAAQYRQALGDYRKGLKLDPNDEAARAMHDEIINIFENSLHREPPKEGEEPSPLPVN